MLDSLSTISILVFREKTFRYCRHLLNFSKRKNNKKTQASKGNIGEKMEIQQQEKTTQKNQTIAEIENTAPGKLRVI